MLSHMCSFVLLRSSKAWFRRETGDLSRRDVHSFIFVDDGKMVCELNFYHTGGGIVKIELWLDNLNQTVIV